MNGAFMTRRCQWPGVSPALTDLVDAFAGSTGRRRVQWPAAVTGKVVRIACHCAQESVAGRPAPGEKDGKLRCDGYAPVVCPESGGGTRFVQSGALHEYGYSRSAKTPLQEGCGKKHSLSGDLMVLWRSYSGRKCCICPHEGCGKRYSHRRTLREHMRSHGPERFLVCHYPDCGKAFGFKKVLHNHLRWHTGERCFVCPESGCRKNFVSSASLIIHVRTHTREKPFVCPWPECDTGFACAGNLATHMRKHTGEKPYVCPQQDCKKSFTRSAGLKIHLRSHSAKRRLACPRAGDSKRGAAQQRLRVQMFVPGGRRIAFQVPATQTPSSCRVTEVSGLSCAR